VTANMHFDEKVHAGSDAIVASARAHGAPVIAARQLLEWVDGRNASSFRSVTWADGTLRFTVELAPGARNARVMVPTGSPAGPLVEIVGDAPLPYVVRIVKGVTYAFFAAAPGSYVV